MKLAKTTSIPQSNSFLSKCHQKLLDSCPLGRHLAIRARDKANPQIAQCSYSHNQISSDVSGKRRSEGPGSTVDTQESCTKSMKLDSCCADYFEQVDSPTVNQDEGCDTPKSSLHTTAQQIRGRVRVVRWSGRMLPGQVETVARPRPLLSPEATSRA